MVILNYMTVAMGNKVKIGATISPYLNERADELEERMRLYEAREIARLADNEK